MSKRKINRKEWHNQIPEDHKETMRRRRFVQNSRQVGFIPVGKKPRQSKKVPEDAVNL